MQNYLAVASPSRLEVVVWQWKHLTVNEVGHDLKSQFDLADWVLPQYFLMTLQNEMNLQTLSEVSADSVSVSQANLPPPTTTYSVYSTGSVY